MRRRWKSQNILQNGGDGGCEDDVCDGKLRSEEETEQECIDRISPLSEDSVYSSHRLLQNHLRQDLF
jgi:hypothetical protein